MATDSNAIYAAMFPANVQRIVGNNARVQAELRTGFIDQYSGSNPADCANAGRVQTPTALKITANPLVNVGIAAIPVVGPIIVGALQIFSKIFSFGAAHRAAVAKEQGTLCSLIPQVNQTLADTDAAVASGQISAAQADAQLEQMVAGFESATATIYKDCNAACVMRGVVRAEATIHEQKYHNSPIYYLKHYWWIGALVFVGWLFLGHRVIVRGN